MQPEFFLLGGTPPDHDPEVTWAEGEAFRSQVGWLLGQVSYDEAPVSTEVEETSARAN